MTTENQDSDEEKKQDKQEQVELQTLDLFDGKSLTGWKSTNFGGEGEVLVEDGNLVMEMGQTQSGITFQGIEQLPIQQLPTDNYELKITAKKLVGNDFFVGLTFPVGDSFCSLICGGWGGTVVGLSTIDGKDAARNETRFLHNFEANRNYQIRVKVAPDRIQCWIDEERVIDQIRSGHEFSIRPEVALSRPLGISSFQTATAIEKIQLVREVTK